MTRKRRITAKKKSESEPQGLLDRIISVAEKDRFTVITGFAYLSAIMAARAWLEGKVLGYASLNLYYFAWQISFFATAFMGGVMVLGFFSGAGFRKSCNFTLFTFWIILLPPLLDYFIFGTAGLVDANAYYYLTKDTFVNFLLPSPGGAQSSWGLRVLGACVMAGGALYLWARTRSPQRSAAGCFGLFSLVAFLAARPLIITAIGVPAAGGGFEKYIMLFSYFRFPVLNYYGWLPDIAYAGYLIVQQEVLMYIAYNLILFVLFFFLAIFASSREKFRGFIESVRLLRHVHFIMMGMLGVIIVRTIDLSTLQHPYSHPGYLPLDPAYILHVPYILLIALSVFFAWQFTTMLNDIHDLKIDRVAHPNRGLVTGAVSKDEYRQAALMFGILACCTSAVLGLIPFLLIIAFLALGVIYSVPPVRFRDNAAGSLIIGMGSMLAYFIGVYSPGHWEVVYWELENNVVVYQEALRFARIPPLTGDILVVGIMILIALTLAPLMTQMRDYEGDAKAGVRSIFTELGYEKGRRVVRILVPLLFLLPLLVINSLQDLLLLPLLAIAAFLILLKSKNIIPVFAIYFAAALYSLIRILM